MQYSLHIPSQMKRKQEGCDEPETVKRYVHSTPLPADQYLSQTHQLTTVHLLAGAAVGGDSGMTVGTDQAHVQASPCLLATDISYSTAPSESSSCDLVIASHHPFGTTSAAATEVDNTPTSTSLIYPNSLENTNVRVCEESEPGGSSSITSLPSPSSAVPVKPKRRPFTLSRTQESPAERQQRLSHKFDALVRAKIIELVKARGIKKTVCPSEVARALSPKAWRDLMPAVRKVGCQLVNEGFMLVTQRGTIVDLAASRGPVRFGLAK